MRKIDALYFAQDLLFSSCSVMAFKQFQSQFHTLLNVGGFVLPRIKPLFECHKKPFQSFEEIKRHPASDSCDSCRVIDILAKHSPFEIE
jgi:hypothetical protein